MKSGEKCTRQCNISSMTTSDLNGYNDYKLLQVLTNLYTNNNKWLQLVQKRWLQMAARPTSG